MKGATVLLVDDDQRVLEWLAPPLWEAGYRVLTASSGSEALEAVRAESPDLILLDQMMPWVDGFHVLSQLKSDPATAAIPVGMLLGTPAVAQEIPAIMGRRELYDSDDIELTVIKPFLRDTSELVAAVYRVLPAFVDELAVLDVATIESLASRWRQCEEMEGWGQPEAVAVLREMAEFARRALREGKPVLELSVW